MYKTKIIGSGVFVPPFVMSNEQLCSYYPNGPLPEYGQKFNWSPKWIEAKLGIKERRFAFDFDSGKMREGFYDLDLAENASRNALRDAGIGMKDVDAIIYVSSTPEKLMPDPGPQLKARFSDERDDTAASGRTTVGCGGFIYAMIEANALIASGQSRTVLISASTSVSTYASCYYERFITDDRKRALMARDRFNASLFGDGAGAMVLQRSDEKEPMRFVSTYWGADGKNNFATFKGGSRNPPTIESVLSGMHFYDLDAPAIAKKARKYFVRTVNKVLEKAGLSIKDIDYFIFHQINHVLLHKLLHRLGISPEKTSIHVDRYGNLDTATLAFGFHEAKTAGKIKKGDLVLFSALGAGLQYGSAILEV